MEEEHVDEVPVHPFFSKLENRNKPKNRMKLAPLKMKKKKRRRKKRRRGGAQESEAGSLDSQTSETRIDNSFTLVSPSKKPTVNINTEDLFSLSVANKRKRSRRNKRKKRSDFQDNESTLLTPASQSTRPLRESVEITITKPSPEMSKENNVPRVKKRKRKRRQYKPPRVDDVGIQEESPKETDGEDEFQVFTNPPPTAEKEARDHFERKYARKEVDSEPDVKYQPPSIPKVSRKRNSDDIVTDNEDKLEEEIEELPPLEEDEQENRSKEKKGVFRIPPLKLGGGGKGDEEDDDDSDFGDEILEDHQFLETPSGVDHHDEDDDESETPEEHSFSQEEKKPSTVLLRNNKEDDPEVQSIIKLTKKKPKLINKNKLPSLIGGLKRKQQLKKRRERDEDEKKKKLDIELKDVNDEDRKESIFPKSPKEREESSGKELRDSKDEDDEEESRLPPLALSGTEEEEEVVIDEEPKPKRSILGVLKSRAVAQKLQRRDDNEVEVDENGEEVEPEEVMEEEQQESAQSLQDNIGEENIFSEEMDGEIPLPIDQKPPPKKGTKAVISEKLRLAEVGKHMNTVGGHMSTVGGHAKSVGRRAMNLVHNFSYHDPLARAPISETQKKLNRFRSPLTLEKPILQVNILRCRMLRNVVRPFVKVTFIDTEKKTLLAKGGGNSYLVSHRYEYVGGSVGCGHILPQSTHMFPVFRTKSLRPIWNEKLVFNENFGHFMNQNAVVVFEILDFDVEKKDMVYVAWGFLKLMSLSGRANARRTLPIKLYKYPKRLSKNVVLKHPETKAYHLWSTTRKRTFPSVLIVSVDPVERKKFIRDSQACPNPIVPIAGRRKRIGEDGEEIDGEYEDEDFDIQEVERHAIEGGGGSSMMIEDQPEVDSEHNVPPPNKSSEKKKVEEELAQERPKTPESPESKKKKKLESILPSILQKKKKLRDSFGRRIVRFPRRTKNIFEVETGRETFEEIAQAFGFTRIRKKSSEDGEEDDLLEMEEKTATMKDKERRARDLRRKLRRKNHERCKIPDTALFQFETAQFGCLRVRFSPNSGVYLACCCVGLESSVVRVYNVWTGQLFKELVGHRQIIYDVCWGKDDTFLVTAGQDGTARIYDFSTIPEEEEEEEEEIKEIEEQVEEPLPSEEVIEIIDPEQPPQPQEPPKIKKKKKRRRKKKNTFEIEARCILPHPCFVYCVQIYYPPEPYQHRMEVDISEGEEEKKKLENDNRLVLTGGYDHMIRIFSFRTGEKLREISHHHARVNSILFDRFKRNMYTADGSGIIKKWRTRNQIAQNPGEKVKPTQFEWLDTFEVPNCHAPLTTIYRHPERDDWLFVHSQDNMIRLMSTVGQKCIGKYTGVKCILNAQRSNVSPDEYGSFIVTGSSNDGNCYFWKRKEQKLVKRYGINYGFGNNPIYDVAWSKKEHVIAVCSYGVPEPVRLYCYEKKKGEDRSYSDDEDDSEEEEEMIVSLTSGGRRQQEKNNNKKNKKKVKFDWRSTMQKVRNQAAPKLKDDNTRTLSVEEKMKTLFSKLQDLKKRDVGESTELKKDVE